MTQKSEINGDEMMTLEHGQEVGLHRLDVFVEDTIVVDLKAIKNLEDIHFAIGDGKGAYVAFEQVHAKNGQMRILANVLRAQARQRTKARLISNWFGVWGYTTASIRRADRMEISGLIFVSERSCRV